MIDRSAFVEEFYHHLSRLERGLGGTRRLKDCDGRLAWPARGVYFFFEPGEYRGGNSNALRVVRVGTHAVSTGSRTTLWHRLSTHRGPGHGRGNHRGSIFRLHVGMALIQRSNGSVQVPTWGKGQSAKKEVKQQEAGLERMVSAYIGQMPFLWLEVEDEPRPNSNRSIIERNSIVLLAGPDGCSPADRPSENWLGRYSAHRKIRESGLWNLNYVGEPDRPIGFNPDFLKMLGCYVDSMVGKDGR